ncbi:MAG: hypothetical protein HFACDABA_03074 [Anaerolineales bacterium]|nr:hypothetical protein [Anaerolineales bacterium]
MKRPTFFVVGAPRCGTTALYTYLSEHPSIFLPVIKELHYFAADFPDVHKIQFRSDEDYLKMFADADSEVLAAGDISPLHIYSRTALERIHAFNPAAKILLILRNPVDFVQSIHQLNLGILREDVKDLARAWDLQEERRQGRQMPPSCREPQLVQYGNLGSFGKHLERVYSVFPRKQVMVILFDDFAADPKAVYESILAFLKVPSDGRTNFPTVNASFEQRSQFVARIFHPARSVYRFFMKVISIFGVNFMKNVSVFYGKVEALNTRPAPRAKMDPALRARLQAYFRDDIEKLARLLGRDLSAWL